MRLVCPQRPGVSLYLRALAVRLWRTGVIQADCENVCFYPIVEIQTGTYRNSMIITFFFQKW